MEKLTMTCNGLAHTLESTLMATHSGFAALLQLTHQFRAIKHSVGQVFGVLSFLRWLKSKILGGKSSSTMIRKFSIQEFESYKKSKLVKTSWIILIAISISVVPMVMQLYQQQQQQKKQCTVATNCLEKKEISPPQPTPTKTTKLDFARALYSFHAESPSELTIRPNDLIAILSKDDNDWWHGRLKNGKIGYFPANHVEIIEKNIEIPSKPSIAPSA